MRPKAIVMEKSKTIDVSRADTFGEIHYVFPMGSTRSSIWTEEFVDEAIDALAELSYDPALDYIVLVGSQVPLIKVVGRLVAIYGRIRILCWHSTDRDYVLQEIGHARNSEGSLCSG